MAFRRLSKPSLCSLLSLASLFSAALLQPTPSNASVPVQAKLIADKSKVSPGTEFKVGVLLRIQDGWHVYWTYPGNTGKPTKIELSADESCAAVGEANYPAPEVFEGKGLDQLSFVYHRDVLIWADATVFESPKSGKAMFDARAEWLACKESCVPGQAKLSLALPVAEKTESSSFGPIFEKAATKTPRTLDVGKSSLESISWKDGVLSLDILVRGVEDIKEFVPTWGTWSACKISNYEARKARQGGSILHVEFDGLECLPWASAVLKAGGKGEKEIFLKAPALTIAPSKGPSMAREHGPAVNAPKASRDTTPSTASRTGGSRGFGGSGFLLFLALAFLGGMILNVMPCVIPVVVPKIMHLVRTASRLKDPAERKRHLFANAVAYTAGVMATMLSIGAVVVVLRSLGVEVGWGFQFQNPFFLVFMIALLVVLGLGMLEVFPLRAGKHAEGLRKLKQYRGKSPLMESFMTGLLVTFLGTPCTAPMLGPALGYAFTRGTFEILLLLATVGFGLSFPFIMLGVWTGWTRILPKRVSETYDKVMRGLSFLLFATAVWLVTVLADGFGAGAAGSTLWFLLALALAAWIFGLIAEEGEGWSRRLVKLVPLLLAVLLVGYYVLDFDNEADAATRGVSASSSIHWIPFSEEKLEELKASGKPVFVDFTAQWCMNCKFNEKTVIETEHTARLLRELGYAAVKADNTRRSSVIQSWLKRFGRAGVPMYLVYPPCAPDQEAKVLPEILTRTILDKALKEAASKSFCGKP